MDTENDDPLLCGQVDSKRGFLRFRWLLSDPSLRIETRESSLRQEGQYIKVRSANNEECTIQFERINSEEWLMDGDSNSVESLEALARLISQVLSRRAVKHRIEIYNGDETMRCYLNFDWPQLEKL